uniref:Uncharacterized protein n=1 Tax=Echinococcus canadensis TaxID=519352 RepID=A0A915EXH5_9CEST
MNADVPSIIKEIKETMRRQKITITRLHLQDIVDIWNGQKHHPRISVNKSPNLKSFYSTYSSKQCLELLLIVRQHKWLIILIIKNRIYCTKKIKTMTELVQM